jgi:hypothetical protein
MSKRVASGEGPTRFRPKNWYRKIYKDCQITTYSRQCDTALFEARYSVSEHLWKLGIETLPVCESGTYRTALEAHAAAYLAAISYVDVLTTFGCE